MQITHYAQLILYEIIIRRIGCELQNNRTSGSARIGHHAGVYRREVSLRQGAFDAVFPFAYAERRSVAARGGLPRLVPAVCVVGDLSAGILIEAVEQRICLCGRLARLLVRRVKIGIGNLEKSHKGTLHLGVHFSLAHPLHWHAENILRILGVP